MKFLYPIVLFCCVFFVWENAIGRTVLASKQNLASSIVLENHQLPATIPVKRSLENSDDKISVTTKIILSISFVVMIAVYFFYSKKLNSNVLSLLKKSRLSHSINQPHLALSKQIALTGKHSLHLVVWDGEELLLGCADQTITLIARRKRTEMELQTGAHTTAKELNESCDDK